MPSPNRTVIHQQWCARNQPAATSVLLDTCTITRAVAVVPGSGIGVDPTTGALTVPEDVQEPATIAADIPCRVSYQPTRAKRERAGDELVTEAQHLVQVPITITTVDIGDVVTITASQDPQLVGWQFTVLKVDPDSLPWTRLLRCERFSLT